ncbi:hypothetical protein [Alteromonas sp. 14N.309.X.WAT.G.H12]|uniref:hypothetical protein n=1 Tax=Alteromonas sp. 14N.309.X.WAT.G.H12 TaxID=3120824 RepID=UPI002FD4958D
MKATKVNVEKNLKRVQRLFKNVDFKALGTAMQVLAKAASETHGHNCLSISLLAQCFLERRGIKSRLMVGESAWRVDGKSSGGVISHTGFRPGISTSVVPEKLGSKALHFHAWLALNEYWSLDLTTYQFQEKMDLLNQDGQNTPVTWTPEFLVFSKSDISSFEAVQQSFSSKVINYTPLPALYEEIITYTGRLEVCEQDVSTLTFIYDAVLKGELETVIGPNGTVLLDPQ